MLLNTSAPVGPLARHGPSCDCHLPVTLPGDEAWTSQSTTGTQFLSRLERARMLAHAAKQVGSKSHQSALEPKSGSARCQASKKSAFDTQAGYSFKSHSIVLVNSRRLKPATTPVTKTTLRCDDGNPRAVDFQEFRGPAPGCLGTNHRKTCQGRQISPAPQTRQECDVGTQCGRALAGAGADVATDMGGAQTQTFSRATQLNNLAGISVRSIGLPVGSPWFW